MKTQYFLLTGLLSLMILTACSDPKQETIDRLETEVMKVHDEVMPRMDEIYTLQKQVEERLEDEALDDSTRQALQDLNGRLGDAAEGMMVWMREYQPPATMPDASADSVISTLRREQKRIEKVSKDMNEALAEGQAALNMEGKE